MKLIYVPTKSTSVEELSSFEQEEITLEILKNNSKEYFFIICLYFVT